MAESPGDGAAQPDVVSGCGRCDDHDHSRLETVRTQRRVRIVVDNVTAMTRLLDVVDLFEGDFRVGLDFAWNSADPQPNGLAELFAAKGVFPVPPGCKREYHLAITAGHSGLRELKAPILSLPHGIRYTKIVPEARKPGSPEARKPGSPEARKPGSPEARKPGSLRPVA